MPNFVCMAIVPQDLRKKPGGGRCESHRARTMDKRPSYDGRLHRISSHDHTKAD